MKRCVLSLLLLLPVVCSAQFRNPSYSELQEGEAVSYMRRHVGFLSSAFLEGRGAGTQGELEAARYMAQEFERCGLDLLCGRDGDVFGMKRENGDTLVSRNVVAAIQGYDAALKDRYIVVGARLDNMAPRNVNVDGVPNTRIFPGANGNASGLAMLLQLARTLQYSKVLLKRTVIFAAFGASVPDGAGAWYFLNRSFSGVGNIDAMVNLDMVGTGSRGFYVYTSSNGDMDALVRRMEGTLQPVQPRLVALEPVRSDHRIFYDKEIPSAFFTTGMYPEYNSEKDTQSVVEYGDMELEAEYVHNFVLELANGRKMDFSPSSERKNRTVPEEVVPYYECDRKPSFLGSTDPVVFLKKWVYTYLRYPKSAVAEGVQGRVLVDFVIDEKGKVRDVKVARGVDPRLDDEAVRAISSSPDWKPGMVNGKKVKSGISLYVEFRLKKR